jgi:cytochrome c556
MRLTLRAGVVATSALVVLGCASGQSKMSTPDAIAARQQLMKEQGAALRSIQDKIKAGQPQAIGPDAEKLAETARRISALFPSGSLDPRTSRAKPEIWQKWAEFEGYAKTLDSKATQLAATSRTAAPAAASASVGDLAKTTCGACHNAFRGPEIKK